MEILFPLKSTTVQFFFPILDSPWLLLLNSLITVKVIIGWEPGHPGIDGNEMTDKLAKVGSGISMNGPESYLLQEGMDYEPNHVWVKPHGQKKRKWKKSAARPNLGAT